MNARICICCGGLMETCQRFNTVPLCVACELGEWDKGDEYDPKVESANDYSLQVDSEILTRVLEKGDK